MLRPKHITLSENFLDREKIFFSHFFLAFLSRSENAFKRHRTNASIFAILRTYVERNAWRSSCRKSIECNRPMTWKVDAIHRRFAIVVATSLSLAIANWVGSHLGNLTHEIARDMPVALLIYEIISKCLAFFFCKILFCRHFIGCKFLSDTMWDYASTMNGFHAAASVAFHVSFT